MAELTVLYSSSNSVNWLLESLDTNYSRPDRLVNLKILDSSYQELKSQAHINESRPWEKKNNLYPLPARIRDFNGTWKHSLSLPNSKKYYLQSIIYFSYGKIGSEWELYPELFSTTTIKNFFPCYPYLNLGDGHGCSIDSKGNINQESLYNIYNQKICSETQINELYRQYNSDITQLTKHLLLVQVTNDKKDLKHNIIQWFSFPSANEVIAEKGNFTWKKWIANKKFTTQVKIINRSITISSVPEEIKVPAYEENFLDPSNNVTITPSVISQYKALFPPIIESYQPAFVGKNNSVYEIFFKLSDYTNFEEVAHVDLRITQQSDNANVVNTNIWTDKVIYKPKKDIINYGNGLYSVKITGNAVNFENNRYDLKVGHWEEDTYYKVQLRLGTEWTGWENQAAYLKWRDSQIKQGQFSEWSTVMILKSIPEPKITILNNSNLNIEKINSYTIEINRTPTITGVYNFKGNEILDQYKFILYNNTGNVLEDSGWLQYNTSKAIGSSEASVAIEHRFNLELNENEQYSVIFYINTINYYQGQSKPYQFKVLPTQTNIFNFPKKDTLLISENDDENGIIKLYIQNNSNKDITIKGNLVLSRKEYYKDQIEDLTLLNFSELNIKRGKTSKVLYIDFTPENGVKYIYQLAEINSLGQKGIPLITECETNFEHYFIFKQGKQLKIKYNPQIESFKYTVLAAKQDTLGGKFPTILQNGMAHYAEFPIGGLLSLHAEEEGDYFYKITQEDFLEDKYYDTKKLYLHGRVEKYNENGEPLIKSINHIKNSDKQGFKTETELTKLKTFNTNLTADNFFLEKKYRDAAESFLNDGEYKLFRSPTEGNFIIGLINVSLKPNQQLGRMLSNFSATAYEIAEYSLKNLKELSILNYSEETSAIYGNKKIIGQIKGLYEENINLLEVINSKILSESQNQYSLNYLDSFSLEPYPKVSNLESGIKYTTALQPEQNLENYKMLLTKLNESKSYFPIEFQISSFGENNNLMALPDSVYQNNKQKLYYNSKRKDNFRIVNQTPIILNYLADINIANKKEQFIDYSFAYNGYGQLRGYFFDSNKEFSKSSDLNLKYRFNLLENTYFFKSNNGDNYYNSLNLLILIASEIIQNIGISMKESFQYKYNETLGYFEYEDDEYDIIINNIPFLEIETDVGTKLDIDGQEIIMNNTEKYCLEDINEKLFSNKQFLGFKNETYATVNYSYTLTVIKKGVKE